MKRFARIICLFIVLSIVVAIPAYAEAQTSRASSFFTAYRAYCSKASSTSLEVSFHVIGAGPMDILGASQIKVQRSSDGENWTTVKTFDKADYSNMTDTNTAVHGSVMTCSITGGHYYRAVVTFYAKNSTGVGFKAYYTAKV